MELLKNTEIINGDTCVLHHTAYARGYVSRKQKDFAAYEKEPYSGKFGKGYRVLMPCYLSTSYYVVAYYIKAN